MEIPTLSSITDAWSRTIAAWCPSEDVPCGLIAAVVAAWAALVGALVLTLAVLYVWLGRHVRARRDPALSDPPQRLVDERLFWSARQMSLALARGDMTSASIVDAAIEHVAGINCHLNAVVHARYAAARREAAAADEKLKRARKTGNWSTVGWLTGVPITVKECFAVQGCPNTSGLPARAALKPAAADAPQVQLLREAGAVILGVTNTSELCMWMESSNPVYGTTNNAYDVHRIVGGSSGGEGCAVSALFAPVGLGSDIGGSIRMPAYFNGVFGHKASSRLITNKGQHPGCRAQGHFLLTTGPLARSAGDLYPMLRTLTQVPFGECPDAFPPCPPLRDPATVDVGKLKVFLLEDLGIGFARASPEQRRAARVAANSLGDRYGCAVHRVDLRDAKTVPPGWDLFPSVFDYWSTLMTFNGERTFTDFMGEGYPEGKLPPLRHEFRRWARREAGAHTLPALGLCLLERVSALQPEWMIRRSRERGDRLRAAIEAALGDDGVLIVPTYPDPVPVHHEPLLVPLKWVYTAAFNALQTPATAVPVWVPGDAAQRTPLGVQCVARWGRDDICLATALALEATLGGYRAPKWAVPEKRE